MILLEIHLKKVKNQGHIIILLLKIILNLIRIVFLRAAVAIINLMILILHLPMAIKHPNIWYQYCLKLVLIHFLNLYHISTSRREMVYLHLFQFHHQFLLLHNSNDYSFLVIGVFHYLYPIFIINILQLLNIQDFKFQVSSYIIIN